VVASVQPHRSPNSSTAAVERAAADAGYPRGGAAIAAGLLQDLLDLLPIAFAQDATVAQHADTLQHVSDLHGYCRASAHRTTGVPSAPWLRPVSGFFGELVQEQIGEPHGHRSRGCRLGA
jgi:hypothetical protein